MRTSGTDAVARRLLLAAALLLGAACGDDAPDPVAAPDATTTTITGGPLDVSELTETFVDSSRPTPAGAETPASDARTLVTRIAHPTSGGPYPLVVLSHGLTGHPAEFTDTVPMWAADGFVVASPAFPLTKREVPGAGSNVADVANQPGDVSFVIDQVLAANDDPASELYGLVDPEAIGVVGHSLGGATTYAVTYDTTEFVKASSRARFRVIMRSIVRFSMVDILRVVVMPPGGGWCPRGKAARIPAGFATLANGSGYAVVSLAGLLSF